MTYYLTENLQDETGRIDIEEAIEEYAVDKDGNLKQVQANLAEALNQICPQVFDDTAKRNAIWCILHSMHVIGQMNEDTGTIQLHSDPSAYQIGGVEPSSVMIDGTSYTPIIDDR